MHWFVPYAVCCACRVANIRKHQLLKPEIKVLMTAVDSITPSNYVFEYLEAEAADMQQMNLQLGFPANIVHVIRPNSPLYSLSLQVRHTPTIHHCISTWSAHRAQFLCQRTGHWVTRCLPRQGCDVGARGVAKRHGVCAAKGFECTSYCGCWAQGVVTGCAGFVVIHLG
jgi:hypothetical protein